MQSFGEQLLIEEIKHPPTASNSKGRLLPASWSRVSPHHSTRSVTTTTLLWSTFSLLCLSSLSVSVGRVVSRFSQKVATRMAGSIFSRLSQSVRQWPDSSTAVASNLQLLISERGRQILALLAIVICSLTQIEPSVAKSFFILQFPSAQSSQLEPPKEWVSPVICSWWTLASLASLPLLTLSGLMSVFLNGCDQKLARHRQCQSPPSTRNHFHLRRSSLISRFTLCLLVSCLLPQRALLSPPPSLHDPLGTFSAVKLRTGATISIPKPLPLVVHSADNATAQICPLFLAPGAGGDESDSGDQVQAQRNTSNSSQWDSDRYRNPCVCYGADNNGIFVECTSASLRQINATLGHLRRHRNAVRSLSIYRLNESSVLGALPPMLFEPFSSITELHISSSNLSQLGSDLTFSGLENSLHTLSFVNSQISSIPKSTLSKLRQLQSLDIQANRIANLESYAFYGLPLRTLNLQNNIIENLHEFAFGGLENTLEELSLIGNRLANFPLFSLRRLRKLLALKLQSNLISQIPDDGFTRFTLLETLDLQSNQIRHLNSRSFITMPKLKTLYCSNNLLTVVSDSSIFAQLHYLETLDLSLNRLRVVNLDGLESVRTLDLSYNHLHDLRLQGMLGLRELFASHNNILQLVNETFLNCTSLEVLYLQHNSIHSILYNAFHRLTELRVLDLSFNQLRQLHSTLFKYTSQLESLNLDHNVISDTGLESGIFQELVELRDLRLQRNLLKHIRKGVFYSLPNLQELDLQMNEIESIESLESLASLQHINLQGNRLATFSGNVLSSFPSSLRYLQLSNNRLETLQNDTFRGQTDLEVIWLNHNRLKRITVNIFSDQINLEKLYLDHNEITAIEDNSFASLRNLVYLSLEHNQLNHLNSDIFRGLEMLTELRLSDSEIIGIEPNVMANLSSLQIVHLSNNQIYTIRRSMFEGATRLEQLYLANVMADEVEADSFERLVSLQVLDISGNSINARRMNSIRLPSSIRQLNVSHNNLSNEKGVELSAEFIQQVNQSLQVLDLSSTHFRMANSAAFFSPLKQLRSIYLDGNELSSIETNSFPIDMVAVETISLSHNRFDSLPDHSLLSKFAPNLKTLSLSHNQIKQIKANALENLTKLEALDLSFNRISVVESHAFSGLVQLTSLDLTGNVLRSLSPDVFIELEQVVHISLANNWLQFIPNNLLKVSTSSVAFASSLQTLDVDHNPMIRLREDLSSEGNFANLQTLKAQHGNITIIASHDFVGFSSLTRLYLEDNQIQTISPSAFRPLDSLVELDLSRNKLDNLPEERLGGLYRLEVLNLSSNSLTELPHFSPDLSNLRTIDISFNKISRIESFGHLSASVSEISLRHNMVSWIANNAFQNMSSLTKLDLRQNFLTQISEAIFESIEVRMQSIQLAGNPFHCDCRLLSIYEWLEEHSRVVKLDEEEEMVCDQPEKLKHQSIQSLQPIDFCPIPMITTFDVLKVEPSSVRVSWQVQNETLVGGFTLEYYLTSERSLTSPAGLQLNPAARTAELRDLIAEKWYTVCVEANGKYLRASSPSASSLEAFSKPTAFMLDHHPQKHLLQDFVTSNRKCSQVRTLTSVESRKLIAIPAASIIIAIGLFFVLILCVCVLAFILFRFRKKRRIQRQRSATVVSFGSIKPASEAELDPAEEYITYRHFSLPSNENVYS